MGRLGGSLGRLGAVLAALKAMLTPSGSQKAPKKGAWRGLFGDFFSRGRFLIFEDHFIKNASFSTLQGSPKAAF